MPSSQPVTRSRAKQQDQQPSQTQSKIPLRDASNQQSSNSGSKFLKRVTSKASLRKSPLLAGGEKEKEKEKESDKAEKRTVSASSWVNIDPNRASLQQASSPGSNGAGETMDTYLRLRPPPTSLSSSTPLLPTSFPPGTIISDSYKLISPQTLAVLPPQQQQVNYSGRESVKSRGSQGHSFGLVPTANGPTNTGTTYTFTSILPPSISQTSVFSSTTLPLIDAFLPSQPAQQGKNALLFCYGTTGSGKTWTVSGGEGEGEGVLGRTVREVWRRVMEEEGCGGEWDGDWLRPSKVSSVEFVPLSERPPSRCSSCPSPIPPSSSQSKKLAIFISHYEIYNEKIYDLLSSLPASSSSSTTPATTGSKITSLSHWLGVASGGEVRRKALGLKAGEGEGKYVQGLSEVRVRSLDQTLNLLRLSSLSRLTFSTLCNRSSSRSHAVFSIRVLEVPSDLREDEWTSGRRREEVGIRRMSVVDLAGTERAGQTGAKGDRLKEAGNINKSLMVLGQCLEMMRRNQQLRKEELASGGKKKQVIVPFRHSKLTEIFQSFFVGDGKVSMIVNLNPYSTSLDENSHVLKFAALAKGIMVLPLPPASAPPSTSTKPSSSSRPATPAPPPAPAVDQKDKRRKSVKLRIDPKREEEVEVEVDVDVGEEEEVEDDDDGEPDEVVEMLLRENSEMWDRVRELEWQLVQSQMNAGLMMMQIKEELVTSYETKIMEIEEKWERIRDEEVQQAEQRMNKKLEILQGLWESQISSNQDQIPSTPKQPNLRPQFSLRSSISDNSTSIEVAEEDESAAIASMLFKGQGGSGGGRGGSLGQLGKGVKKLRDDDDDDEEEDEEDEEEEEEEETLSSEEEVAVKGCEDYEEEEEKVSKKGRVVLMGATSNQRQRSSVKTSRNDKVVEIKSISGIPTELDAISFPTSHSRSNSKASSIKKSKLNSDLMEYNTPLKDADSSNEGDEKSRKSLVGHTPRSRTSSTRSKGSEKKSVSKKKEEEDWIEAEKSVVIEVGRKSSLKRRKLTERSQKVAIEEIENLEEIPNSGSGLAVTGSIKKKK